MYQVIKSKLNVNVSSYLSLLNQKMTKTEQHNFHATKSFQKTKLLPKSSFVVMFDYHKLRSFHTLNTGTGFAVHILGKMVETIPKSKRNAS